MTARQFDNPNEELGTQKPDIGSNQTEAERLADQYRRQQFATKMETDKAKITKNLEFERITDSTGAVGFKKKRGKENEAELRRIRAQLDLSTYSAEEKQPDSPRKLNPIEEMFSIAESTEIFSGEISRMPEGADKKHLLCNSMRKLGDTYFYGKQAEWEQAIDTVAQGNYASDEELIAAAAQAIFSFSRQQITPREMEQNIRDRFKQEGREKLNEILTYDITGDVVNLHLDAAYTLGIKEKLGLMRSGLSEMARRLEKDESLKNIKTIRTVSWIVAKNSSLLTRLGFTFDGVMSDQEKQQVHINDKRPIGVAHISREDFIRKHGKM